MGKTTTYTYTALGKVESVVDSLNNRQEFTYDSMGRNTVVRDALNNTSTAEYDKLGNVTKLVGPLGGATNYSYDEMGRLISESTSSGGTITYGYNALNIKEQLTNARGQVRKFFYDAMGRITGFVGTEDSVSYTYDANGNVLTVTDSNGTIKRDYDALNRVTKYTDTYGKSICYEYDSVGNLTRLVYPDNTSVTYAYDENKNLVSVTDWANRVTTYTYDVNNRVIGVVKPNGSVTTTVYDNKQRVTSTVEKTALGTVITGFEYTYDTLSKIVEEKHLAENTKICYTYDNLSRVTKRTVYNECNEIVSEENFSYDAAGNITDAPNSCFEYDINNRLITFNGNTVSYDMDGNMLSNGYINCEFDSGNRLISAGDHTYTYNAEDVRIRNLCSDADTTYTYNTNCQLSQLLTKTTNGNTTKYVYGLGLIGEEKCGEFKTYHFDFRGSTVAITDINGEIIDTFMYDTYGNLTEHVGNSFVIFGYNGRDGVVTDRNGLIYMRARYYSPELRRFANADILAGEISNPITLNRYAYANGNPVSLVDPLGLAAERGYGLLNLNKGPKRIWGISLPEGLLKVILPADDGTQIVHIFSYKEPGVKVVDINQTDLTSNNTQPATSSMSNIDYYETIHDTPLKFPKNNTTYCNIWAHEVLSKSGATYATGGCKEELRQYAAGEVMGWNEYTFEEAQINANNGMPTIAIREDHVAVVTPNNVGIDPVTGEYVSKEGYKPKTVKDVLISQSGVANICKYDASFEWAWYDEYKQNSARFFSYSEGNY